MTDLFDKTDVLTVLTLDKVKAGDEGYLGDCLGELNRKIKNGYIQPITSIDQSNYILHPFKNGNTNYALFLPANKVKKKEPVYRPLKNIDELFDFMLPDCAGADYTTDEKVEKLLGQRYTIKDKIDGTLKQHIVSFLDTPADGTLLLDFVDLKFLFENYEFKRGDKFVPFGIEE